MAVGVGFAVGIRVGVGVGSGVAAAEVRATASAKNAGMGAEQTREVGKSPRWPLDRHVLHLVKIMSFS